MLGSSGLLCASVLLLLLSSAPPAFCARRLKTSSKEYDRQHDVLAMARCEARCYQTTSRNACIKLCLSNVTEKAGDCPILTRGTTLSPFASVCLNTCKYDTQCPDITKCCRHSCGVTCQQAQNLEQNEDLPETPTEITVRSKRKRTLQIKWKSDPRHAGTVIYVIEERHRAGKYFVENHMSSWNPCHKSFKANVVLKHVVKPGRWYQFRIAAVNSNGTKGYSEPIGYVAQTGPRAPKSPQNLTVGRLVLISGSLQTEMKWTPPYSDLPIQRYKVFWSRRLQGATALDSVLVLQQTVSKDQTKCVIRDLEADSLYFLQVQALSQFGRDTFRGEKAGIVLNTTNYDTDTEQLTTPTKTPPGKVENLQLQKLFWSQGDLKARITWKSRTARTKHTVNWSGGSCKNDRPTSHVKLAATTKASQFDVYDLQFDCRYRVSVREVTPDGLRSTFNTSITFTTPSCKDLQSKNKRVKCNRQYS